MSDTDATLSQALRDVWLRHRDATLADLQELIRDVETWNAGEVLQDKAERIRVRAHRILGSLTMVGRNERAEDLRSIEMHAVAETGPYAKEVVERVHDLLDHLRNAD